MSYSSVQETLSSIQRELSSIIGNLQQANRGVGAIELNDAVSSIQDTLSDAWRAIQRLK